MSILSKMRFPLMHDRNIRLYYLYTSIFSTWPIQAVLALFMLSKGFNFVDIGWIVFVFNISSILFEVPTGFFADKFGRRNSIIAGLMIFTIFSPLWTVGYELFHFLIIAVFWSAAFAFISGSFEAYLYDYLQEKKWTEHYDAVRSTGTMLVYIATAVGILVGVPAFMLNPNLPYYLVTLTNFAGLIIVLFMQHDTPPAKKANLESEVKVFSGISLILKSPVLLWISAFSIAYFSYYHFFIQGTNIPYLVELDLLPLSGIGVFLAGMSLFQAAIASRFNYFRRRLSVNQLIFALMVLQVGSLFILSAVFGVLGFVFFGIFCIIEPLEQLIVNSLSQKHIKSEIRATTLSSIYLVTSISSALVAIVAGSLTDQVGIRSSFVVVGAVLTVVFAALFAVKLIKKID